MSVGLEATAFLPTSGEQSAAATQQRSQYDVRAKLFVAKQYAARKNGTRNYTELREQILREAREQFPDAVTADFNPKPEVIDKWVRTLPKLQSSVLQPKAHNRSCKKVQHCRPGKSAATLRQWQKEHLGSKGTALLETYRVHIPLTLEWIGRQLNTKAVITQNFERILNTNKEAKTEVPDEKNGRWQFVLVNETRAFRVLGTANEREREPTAEFLQELPDAVLRELEDEVLKVFLEALCFKSTDELLRHYKLRKIVIIWTDKGVSAQYVHTDSPLNKNRNCSGVNQRAFFVLINCDPSKHESKVGCYPGSHVLFDMANSDCATSTPKTIEQVREALPAKHPLKEHGSTIPFKEVALDFLQPLVNDVSLAHYGCEGPPLNQRACSTAFAIHGVLVPRDNLEPEEFDKLQRPWDVMKPLLQQGGGDLYRKQLT